MIYRILNRAQIYLQKVRSENAISIQRTLVITIEDSDLRSNQIGWNLVEQSNKRRDRKANDG